MIGRLWLEITSIAEVISVCLSIPCNLFLIFCIFQKSPRSFGNYRYLMAFFAYQSIWFSVITLFLNVNYFTFETSISMFVRRNFFGLSELGMLILTSLACCSNCVMFVALAVQFIYRYFAMTKSPRLSLFDSWKMSLWYLGMIIASVCFGAVVFIFGVLMEGERPDQEDFRNSLRSTFELPPNETVYYARMTYYKRSPTGHIQLDLCSLGCVFLIFLSLFPVVVMFYCGIRTYRRMSMDTSQLTNHMRLQRELFHALLLQSFVPCIFLFLPTVAFFVFPLFNLKMGLLSSIAGITFVIYPVLDPLVVIYVIKYYRVHVYKIFCLSHKIAPRMVKYQVEEEIEIESPVEIAMKCNEEVSSFHNLGK